MAIESTVETPNISENTLKYALISATSILGLTFASLVAQHDTNNADIFAEKTNSIKNREFDKAVAKALAAETTTKTKTVKADKIEKTDNVENYTVKHGDSIWKIAHEHNMTMDQLTNINQDKKLKTTSTIHPGDVLHVKDISNDVPKVVYVNVDTAKSVNSNNKNNNHSYKKNTAWKVADVKKTDGAKLFLIGNDIYLDSKDVTTTKPEAPKPVKTAVAQAQTVQTQTVQQAQPQQNAVQAPSTGSISLEQFMFNGVVYSGGYKFTYYSQSVLPGGGLNIPGRHVNAQGYVCDGDGYIVAANSAPIGTVINTPFGAPAKVYDRGTFGNHVDIYIR